MLMKTRESYYKYIMRCSKWLSCQEMQTVRAYMTWSIHPSQTARRPVQTPPQRKKKQCTYLRSRVAVSHGLPSVRDPIYTRVCDEFLRVVPGCPVFFLYSVSVLTQMPQFIQGVKPRCALCIPSITRVPNHAFLIFFTHIPELQEPSFTELNSLIHR